MSLAAAVVAAAVAASAAAAPHDGALREGLGLLYDGATDGALLRLEQVSATHPDDPLPAYLHGLALCWKVEQRPHVTDHDDAAEARLEEALQAADRRLGVDPGDLRARLARGAAHGALSRLHLFRARRTAAARAAVRMREDLLVALDLAPGNADALFGLGLYDYYAAVLPRLARVLRFLAGMPAGDRARGLQRIVAARGRTAWHDDEVLAQLYEIHAFYEDEPDAALEAMTELMRRHPDSPLFALKLAEHQRERVGLYAESAAGARAILDAIEARRGNFAGRALRAMAQLALGAALLHDLRIAEARAALSAVEAGLPDAPHVRARAELLLGRARELEGDRTAAARHYRLATLSAEGEVRREAEAALSRPLPAAEAEAFRWVAAARRASERARTTEAAAAYTRALEASPNLLEAALGAAEAALRAGRTEGMAWLEGDLGDRLRGAPPFLRPWAALLRGHLHDLKGRRTLAREAYATVLAAPHGRRDLARRAEQGLDHAFTARPPGHSK